MFFTDKMPENCTSCPCADGEYGVCNIDYNVGLSTDDRVAPVIHAHWIADIDNPFGDLCMCSNCKEKIFDMDADRISFCPYCGAKMKEQKPDPPVGYLYKGTDGIARCSCCKKALRYLVRPFKEMKMCPYCGVKLEPREEE